MNVANRLRHKRYWVPALIVIALLIGGVGAYASVVVNTTTVVSTNTVTVVSFTTVTKATDTATVPITITQSETDTIQPVVTVTSTTIGGPTITTTQTTQTVTSPTTTTTTILSTASSTLFTPPVLYWTATEINQPFFRSISPINSHDGTTLTESIASTVSMGISSANSTYLDAGFYMIVGTLGTLNVGTGHGLTIVGSGFSVNLWVGINSWTWTPINTGVDVWNTLGSGAYGLGTTTGTTTINGATSFQSFSGACSGTLTVSQIAGGSCGGGITASTPVAIWVGIINTYPTLSSATVTSMYLS